MFVLISNSGPIFGGSVACLNHEQTTRLMNSRRDHSAQLV